MKKGDFEDWIQYYSAIRCNSEFIITRNIKDFPNQGIGVLLPDKFIKKLLK
jgi:hypothetical protein